VKGELETGQRLGDYEIVSVAGSGGMGVVYRATQVSLGRDVALKVIRDEIASEPEYQQRFLREARLAASVDHPHVVTVYDVGNQDGRLFLAMQWIDGSDLKEALQKAGRLAPKRAVAVATQLAGALDAVHSVAGLVHRDVKPANALLSEVGGEDHAYLTDFGVAKPSEAADQLTRTGWTVGTTGYLSPEQIKGHEPGPRSDLYALGCLFFEALTGQPPFKAENEMAVRWAHANDQRPTASAQLPALGQRYDHFLSVALAADPDRRFASGRAFAEALQVAHDGEVATAPPHAPTTVGPPTPMLPPAVAPQPQALAQPAYGYVTPAPAPVQQPRSGNPLALILLALVAIAGIAVGALAAAGVFSSGSGQTVASAPAASKRPALRSSSRSQSAAPVAGGTSTASPTVAPPSQDRATTQNLFAESGSPATGTDARGFNVGPGCSDDPASPLPGCNDSPSVPVGDPSGTCANGITVDRQTTSCGLAENVYSSYTEDGLVTAQSPERSQDYTFTCKTSGPGTTGETICLGRAGSSPLYLIWHR
jgi:serine/threonine protein kinase